MLLRLLARAAAAPPIVAALYAALSFGRWIERPETDWDSIRIPDLPTVTVEHPDGNTQRFWLVDSSHVAKLEVQGPLQLRVEFRAVMDKEALSGTLFVSEVKIDGQSHDLSAFRPEPEEGVTWDAIPLGARKRIKVEVPAGTHVIELAKAAGKHEQYLVRFREPERAESETP